MVSSLHVAGFLVRYLKTGPTVVLKHLSLDPANVDAKRACMILIDGLTSAASSTTIILGRMSCKTDWYLAAPVNDNRKFMKTSK